MSDQEILKEKRPEIAEFLEHWQSKYQKAFDFSSTSQQADFYEAFVELGRHIASTTSGASIRLHVSNDGVTRVDVGVTPEAIPPSS